MHADRVIGRAKLPTAADHDLAVGRFRSGSAIGYPSLTAYAHDQIKVLMVGANAWMWLSFVILAGMITTRPLTEAQLRNAIKAQA